MLLGNMKSLAICTCDHGKWLSCLLRYRLRNNAAPCKPIKVIVDLFVDISRACPVSTCHQAYQLSWAPYWLTLTLSMHTQQQPPMCQPVTDSLLPILVKRNSSNCWISFTITWSSIWVTTGWVYWYIICGGCLRIMWEVKYLSSLILYWWCWCINRFCQK